MIFDNFRKGKRCRKCYELNNRGENHPNWKRGFWLDGHGYKIITVENKKFYEHRFLIEKKIGRKLTKNEHVHHINENKLDNRLENLCVLSNSDHGKLHSEIKKKQWSKNHLQCLKCESSEKKHYSLGFCKNCYAKKFRENGFKSFSSNKND